MKRGERLKALSAKRAVMVRTLKQSEKAISDSQRMKREQEASRAASLWTKGYDAETRDK